MYELKSGLLIALAAITRIERNGDGYTLHLSDQTAHAATDKEGHEILSQIMLHWENARST